MSIACDKRSARGFTLVELVVAITVSMVVVGFMAMSLPRR